VIDALYLADSPETAWAEWYRCLAEYGLPPAHALPRGLWRIRVELDGVADLRTPKALRALGLEPPLPSSANWVAFQAVGERLAADGFPALVAPSAARPEGLVLCVFRRDGELGGVRKVGRARRVDQPPAPPRGLRT
jgi:RES domain-containing protein